MKYSCKKAYSGTRLAQKLRLLLQVYRASPKALVRCLQTESCSSADSSLVRAAINAQLPTDLRGLVESLINGAVLHEPGSFLILNKPFGLSCLGYKQKEGGVFRNTRIGRPKDEDESDIIKDQSPSNELTLEAALPFISKHFREPRLSFLVGLKRYVSGPVLLPANSKFSRRMKQSLHRSASQSLDEGFRHKALAICKGVPEERSGTVKGYMTFQVVRDHKEYIFVADGAVKRRAVLGKFAVMGSMDYRVLAHKYGCSLVDITFPKFNRHLPRLMLCHLLSPILGDPIYMQRVVDISGVPSFILPKDVYRTKQIKEEEPVVCKRLGLSQRDLYTKLPLYLHVYRTVFPFIEVRKDVEEHMDLVASSPLPAHFTAMLKCLQLYDAAVKRLNSIDEEDETTWPTQNESLPGNGR